MKAISGLLFLSAFHFNSPLQAEERTLKKEKMVAPKTIENIASAPSDMDACFNPEGNCEEKLLQFAASAQKSIDIAAYKIALPSLVTLLVEKSKKMPIRIIIDEEEAETHHSKLFDLAKSGITLRYGTQIGHMHNKFMLIDGSKLEAGSFNYTKKASLKNQENQIFISDPTIVKKFHDQFEKMWTKTKAVEFAISKNGKAHLKN